MPLSRFVFTVHTDGGNIEIMFSAEDEARTFATSRSADTRVRATAVTRYALGELGNRQPVAWFRDGVEQERDWNRNLYPAP